MMNPASWEQRGDFSFRAITGAPLIRSVQFFASDKTQILQSFSIYALNMSIATYPLAGKIGSCIILWGY